MLKTQTFVGTLVVIECHKCGITYGLPRAKYDRCYRQGEDFYCPNGHCGIFCQTEVQKLNKMLDNAKARAAAAERGADDWRNRAKAARRSLAATKGVVTRAKNRLSKGECPCCKQHFQNLHKHMEIRHPDYGGDGSDG